MKLNCWEFKKCGLCAKCADNECDTRCPVPRDTDKDGINSGKNAGRYCWRIAGTFCGGEIRGTFAKKLQTCIECDFFKSVQDDEGPCFKF